MAIVAQVDGFANLEKILNGFAKMADPAVVEAAQKAGAEHLTRALRIRAAPRGRSRVHMLDAIDFEYDGKGETVVGWRKFYGRFVETGHRAVTGYKRGKSSSSTKSYTLTASKTRKKESASFVRARPHMKPEYANAKIVRLSFENPMRSDDMLLPPMAIMPRPIIV